MAYDEALAERIRTHLTVVPGITEKKMFGGLCFLLHGNMVCGLTSEDFMARVGPDAYADSLARKHAKEMDFTGRPMKGMVFVDREGIGTKKSLASWIDPCVEFASSLPKKAAKKTPAKKTAPQKKAAK